MKTAEKKGPAANPPAPRVAVPVTVTLHLRDDGQGRGTLLFGRRAMAYTIDHQAPDPLALARIAEAWAASDAGVTLMPVDVRRALAGAA